ncbi:hypothetical protein E2562_034997 [Oryza meyeriana var. granulata]|uniref:Uncharacterized protein n=1 Tax=Oryza meyeriana var. granulata TaxID=110450 RepID=A0A6G1CWK5_9ORYZ|nr:hypothetical protein E2562_034997 [Oryza meyeriana var. granulata]
MSHLDRPPPPPSARLGPAWPAATLSPQPGAASANRLAAAPRLVGRQYIKRTKLSGDPRHTMDELPSSE